MLSMILACVCFAGCKKGGDENKIEDVNGFFCLKCESKYLTDADQLMDTCPKCGGPVRPVVAYDCPSCGTVQLDGSGQGSMACSECKTVLTSPRYPTEAELEDWGAVPTE
jgi:ribosomal protein L37AE/L43A